MAIIKELTYEVDGKLFSVDLELVDRINLTHESSIKVVEYTTLNSKVIPVKRKFQYKNDTVYYVEKYYGVGENVVAVDEHDLIRNLVQSIRENNNFEETDFFKDVKTQTRAKRSTVLLSKKYLLQEDHNEVHIHRGLFILTSTLDGHIAGSSERIITNFSANQNATCSMLNASGTVWTNDDKTYRLHYIETDMKDIYPMFTLKKEGAEGKDWQFQVLPTRNVDSNVDLTKIRQQLDDNNWDTTKLLFNSNHKDTEERIMDIFL